MDGLFGHTRALFRADQDKDIKNKRNTNERKDRNKCVLALGTSVSRMIRNSLRQTSQQEHNTPKRPSYETLRQVSYSNTEGIELG